MNIKPKPSLWSGQKRKKNPPLNSSFHGTENHPRPTRLPNLSHLLSDLSSPERFNKRVIFFGGPAKIVDIRGKPTPRGAARMVKHRLASSPSNLASRASAPPAHKLHVHNGKLRYYMQLSSVILPNSQPICPRHITNIRQHDLQLVNGVLTPLGIMYLQNRLQTLNQISNQIMSHQLQSRF